MSKKRRLKRKSEEWQKRLKTAQREEVWISQQAAEFGLELQVNIAESGKTRFPHWQFRLNGDRVMDYWPTSGKYWLPGTGQRGVVGEPQDALNMAIGAIPQEEEDLIQADRHLRSIQQE